MHELHKWKNGICSKCGVSSLEVAALKPCLAGETHPVHDPISHPSYYTSHPSGVECIQITEHMGFNLGNALKYIWRADFKDGLQDLKKAEWYIRREIERREKEGPAEFSK